MSKEKKKSRAEIAAIEQRLVDLAQGAAGGDVFDDGQVETSAGLNFEMGTEEWLRYVEAVAVTFSEGGGCEDVADPMSFRLRNLKHFAERFDVAAKFLHCMGGRA